MNIKDYTFLKPMKLKKYSIVELKSDGYHWITISNTNDYDDIGKYYSNTIGDTTIANATNVTILPLTLPAGTYVVFAQIDWHEVSDIGKRSVSINNIFAVSEHRANYGGWTRQNVSGTCITSNGVTLSLNIYQNSGSNAIASGILNAIKII